MKKQKRTLPRNPLARVDIFKPPEFFVGQKVRLLDVLDSDVYDIDDINLTQNGYVYFISPAPVAHSKMQLGQNLTLVSCETTAIPTSET